ncbi:MAG TPA: VOC family protein [Acidimicrobiales bacterium]|nr:VOC family protein [Acidimicrobiales bacterium]
MTLYNITHVGFLVEDLDSALLRAEKVLGVSFPEPTVAHAPYFRDGERVGELSLRLAWSREGPPHVEMIEAQGDGLYSLRNGEGFHHLGVWETDFDSLARRLERLAIAEQAVQHDDLGGVIANYTDPAGFHNIRLEHVAASRIEQTYDWLSGNAWKD